MTSFLVVCTGNVCRSPIAEGLLRNAMHARFGEGAPQISSAGTQGWEGRPAMAESVAAARERGADIGGHIARALTPAMVQDATLVVTMAQEHGGQIARFGPDARAKTFTLKELVRILDTLPAAPAGARIETLAARRDAADAARRAGFAGNPMDDDIADPLGLPLDSYRAVAWELDEWVQRLDEGLYGAARETMPETRPEARPETRGA
jgi:protein-tyrosine phosphatase